MSPVPTTFLRDLLVHTLPHRDEDLKGKASSVMLPRAPIGSVRWIMALREEDVWLHAGRGVVLVALSPTPSVTSCKLLNLPASVSLAATWGQ